MSGSVWLCSSLDEMKTLLNQIIPNTVDFWGKRTAAFTTVEASFPCFSISTLLN